MADSQSPRPHDPARMDVSLTTIMFGGRKSVGNTVAVYVVGAKTHEDETTAMLGQKSEVPGNGQTVANTDLWVAVSSDTPPHGALQLAVMHQHMTWALGEARDISDTGADQLRDENIWERLGPEVVETN